MKKMMFFVAIAMLAGVMAMGCSDKTQLAFTNSANSQGPVTNLNFASGAATWSGTYAKQATTEAKDVTVTSGSLACQVDAGSGFVTATVKNEATNDDSFSLASGSSNTFTILVVAKKKDE